MQGQPAQAQGRLALDGQRRARTPTAASSSSPTSPPTGSTASTPSSARCAGPGRRRRDQAGRHAQERDDRGEVGHIRRMRRVGSDANVAPVAGPPCEGTECSDAPPIRRIGRPLDPRRSPAPGQRLPDLEPPPPTESPEDGRAGTDPARRAREDLYRDELERLYQPADNEELFAAHELVERYFDSPAARTAPRIAKQIQDIGVDANVVGRLCRIRMHWPALRGRRGLLHQRAIRPPRRPLLRRRPDTYDRTRTLAAGHQAARPRTPSSPTPRPARDEVVPDLQAAGSPTNCRATPTRSS